MLMTMALVHILPETVTAYDNFVKKSGEDGHDHRLLRILAEAGGEEGDSHGGKFPTAYVLFLAGFWIM